MQVPVETLSFQEYFYKQIALLTKRAASKLAIVC